MQDDFLEVMRRMSEKKVRRREMGREERGEGEEATSQYASDVMGLERVR